MKPLEVPVSNIIDQSPSPSARTFRRKGNTYVVKNTQSNEDVQDIYTIIDDLYNETNHMAWWADMKANIFKIMYVLSSIYIIVAGAVVGVLGINNRVVSNVNNATVIQDFSPTNIAIIVLGFSVTTLKALMDVFTIQKRSLLLKQSYIKLRSISRRINNLKNQNLTNTELFTRIDEFYSEIDGLDIIMFNNEEFNGNNLPVTPSNQSNTNINTSSGDVINTPSGALKPTGSGLTDLPKLSNLKTSINTTNQTQKTENPNSTDTIITIT